VGLWKVVQKEWDTFASYIRFEVGNGTQVLFWKDHWDGSGTFQAKYPELFSFARDKDAQVANYMECLHSKVIWKSVFIR